MNLEGFVPAVPMDFEVEVPALVSEKSLQGIKTVGLPKPLIASVLRDRVAPVEVELEAYGNRSRELLLQLIMMDPWIRSEEQARRLLDDVLRLPRHEEMRQHFG